MDYTLAMPYAINYRSDDASADKILRLWARFAGLDDPPSMQSIGYPPHITLAVYDEVTEEALFAGLNEAASCLKRLSVRFVSLGSFRTPFGMALWVAPETPPQVLSAHNKIHSTVDQCLCRPNYRPEAWVPHCSIATSISKSREEEALEAVAEGIEPFEVTFDALDCTSFMPVEVMSEVKFSG